MPIYGYRCSQCGHELEVLQSMSAAPLQECPQCGGQLRKLLYPVGVQFKGSGFYTTDYKNGGGARTAEGSSSSSDGSSSEKSDGSGKSDKAEAKPAGPEKSEKKSEKKAETATGKE
jgi:putative FmdB family regulatory protein